MAFNKKICISKYADFIDTYAELSAQELIEYRERYLDTEGGLMGLAQILRQEGLEQGHQKECIALIMRQLRCRFGIHPELDQALLHIQNMSIEQLETLAEALLDFTEIGDLIAWLQK